MARVTDKGSEIGYDWYSYTEDTAVGKLAYTYGDKPNRIAILKINDLVIMSVETEFGMCEYDITNAVI